MTEFNASDGSWVQTLSGGSYGFYCAPRHRVRRHAPVGHELTGNSVTEIFSH